MVQVNDAARRIWGTSGPLGPSSIFRERRARWADVGRGRRAGRLAAPARAPHRRGLHRASCVEIDRLDGAQATILNSSRAHPRRGRAGLRRGLGGARRDRAAPRRSGNRDEMLQVVSHDLRTPLATVTLGAAALGRLPDGPDAGAQARRAAERISAAGERMARLIDDLLDLAGLEDGAPLAPRRAVRPAELLGEAADELREAAREKGLDLCLSACPGLPPVDGDRDRILQVLGNVASNAVKATDRARSASPPRREATRWSSASATPGPGSPRTTCRTCSTASGAGAAPAGAGSGLGLAIARALVEAHGGRNLGREPGRRGDLGDVHAARRARGAAAPG